MKRLFCTLSRAAEAASSPGESFVCLLPGRLCTQAQETTVCVCVLSGGGVVGAPRLQTQ